MKPSDNTTVWDASFSRRRFQTYATTRARNTHTFSVLVSLRANFLNTYCMTAVLGPLHTTWRLSRTPNYNLILRITIRVHAHALEHAIPFAFNTQLDTSAVWGGKGGGRTTRY